MTDIVYQRRSNLLVQRALPLANYDSVAVALLDPQFRFAPAETALAISKRGTIVGFNLVAALAWDLLDGTRSIASLVEVITARFAVSQETALRDVERLLEELSNLGLVSPV
jgi:hypothetical protein